jgi:hypothetical protein
MPPSSLAPMPSRTRRCDGPSKAPSSRSIRVETEGSGDAAMLAAAARWWQKLKGSKPAPEIFWQFIEADRNTLVKEYNFTAFRSDTAGGQGFMFTPFGVEMFDVRPSYKMVVGPFLGRDARDAVEEAIRWWDQQLQAIEADAASVPKTT